MVSTCNSTEDVLAVHLHKDGWTGSLGLTDIRHRAERDSQLIFGVNLSPFCRDTPSSIIDIFRPDDVGVVGHEKWKIRDFTFEFR